ncbi:RNA polymerase factor sigma-54 [Altererythrobacter salegens]|uniref:RNA polymerase sigma-54 factor n=1 Tax=Croceibacterium salegens TaxID=1737568 RepID=A0A6I4T0J0_9SPHN|nr:RNA polymerase factor sigma-54 [Croceibacterium salegens]MXO61119.1 RNA polymerase factor sigma-54 [Croceibacterium salegens]
MALGPRLDLRQSQSLVMTPQLQQAIRLLAASNLEIEAYIGEALEANPLLDAGEVRMVEREAPPESAEPQVHDATPGEGDQALDIDPTALDRDRDTGDWAAQPAGALGNDDLPDAGERSDDDPTLAEHLEAQVGAASPDRHTELVARHLIGLLDEAGYLPVPLREVAGELGLAIAEVEQALAVVQSLDPTGVGARSLSECLALQAIEADRYDPCMRRLIENLDLVARGEFARLKRMCDVDDEDFGDMLAELRGYDPKPGLKFGGGSSAPVVPDILIVPAGEGWDIRLNEETLPRLVVNRAYYVELRNGCTDKASKSWLSEKLADANWLIKALDQRAKTILKVAAAVAKAQDGFFRRGVSELKPLTLRQVAEEIEMHESTVSRVTSNKYLHCERGTFELKYFFTSGVASSDGEGAVSAEAVKAQIRALCDAEDPKDILSDDKLVELLRDKGFDLARRTVAKYRESIGIGSSVQRRRQKKLQGVG